MSKPKPIADPKAGQYQVVVSFRTAATPAHIEALVRKRLGRMNDLSIGIRRIGAGGEASEHEGTVGLTEEDVPTVRGVENVQPKGGAL